MAKSGLGKENLSLFQVTGQKKWQKAGQAKKIQFVSGNRREKIPKSGLAKKIKSMFQVTGQKIAYYIGTKEHVPITIK